MVAASVAGANLKEIFAIDHSRKPDDTALAAREKRMNDNLFSEEMDQDSTAAWEMKRHQAMRALAIFIGCLSLFTAAQAIGFYVLARSAQLLNWYYARLSVLINVALLGYSVLTWLMNTMAKKYGKSYLRFYYTTFYLAFIVILVGWLFHLHLAASSITMLTISIPATAFLAYLYLGPREGWSFLIYGTIGWVFIIFAERAGLMPYFPLYINNHLMPKDLIRDPRFILINIAMYALICVSIMGLMRRFEREIERRNRALAQAKREIEKTLEQRNEAYQALAGVAHDVKNILAGLEGGSGLVKTALANNNRELLQTGWEIVEVSQDRIKRMVLNMLDYSKSREPNYETVELSEVIGNVADLVRLQRHDYPVTVEAEIEARAARLEADGLSVHRCILNLASNAADALAANPPDRPGKIVIRTRPAEPAGFLAIDVADNGPGIEESKIKELFEAFKSSKGAKGTGLGLAVSRKIAREHGGNILIQSKVGEGTTFTILLPEKKPAQTLPAS